MQKKWILWRIVLIVLSLAPAIWWAIFQDSSVYEDSAAITYSIGIVTWLISYTMLAMTFVLSGRFKWIENMFGWLDKMYIVHAVVWSVSFLFMLAHPIFLVLKYLPSNPYLAAVYLLPGSHRSINFGIWAFLFIIILMCITLFLKKVKYHHWKASHTFFSLAFVFVAVHVFMIKLDLAEIYFPGYNTYTIWVWIIGIASYIYTIARKRLNSSKFYTYQVVWMHHYNAATELIFAPVGKYMKYDAWQFAFVKFQDADVSKESHPYSFASYNPRDNKFRMIIKHSWDYTKTLSNLQIGDRAIVEWPYGKFTMDMQSPKQIRIAGWIGITPFISMAEKAVLNPDMKVDLYYLARHKEDLVGLDHLQEIAKLAKWLRVIPWISSEKWHIKVANIIENSGDIKQYEYSFCWPEQMKQSLIQTLIQYGITHKQIHMEWYNFKI